jgi:hypothetical protein
MYDLEIWNHRTHHNQQLLDKAIATGHSKNRLKDR